MPSYLLWLLLESIGVWKSWPHLKFPFSKWSNLCFLLYCFLSWCIEEMFMLRAVLATVTPVVSWNAYSICSLLTYAPQLMTLSGSASCSFCPLVYDCLIILMVILLWIFFFLVIIRWNLSKWDTTHCIFSYQGNHTSYMHNSVVADLKTISRRKKSHVYHMVKTTGQR